MMNKCVDGFESRPPFFVRWIVRAFFRGRFLTKPMSAGFKLPKAAAAELIPQPPVTFGDGVTSIREAIDRLKSTPTRVASPLLGPMNIDEWTQLHCRHAELHFSFLLPVN